MTIIKIKEIADYIKNYINKNNCNNYKTFTYFYYDNFYKILSNLLNGYYDIITNTIIITDYIIYINKNNNDIIISIVENDLIEPKGPI